MRKWFRRWIERKYQQYNPPPAEKSHEDQLVDAVTAVNGLLEKLPEGISNMRVYSMGRCHVRKTPQRLVLGYWQPDRSFFVTHHC